MKTDRKVKDKIQYIAISDAMHKKPNYYHLSKMKDCTCGCVNRKFTDLNKGKNISEHAYQFSCARCGKKSEPKSSRTLAIQAWNEIQRES
jgi:hypothetical protein